MNQELATDQEFILEDIAEGIRCLKRVLPLFRDKELTLNPHHVTQIASYISDRIAEHLEDLQKGRAELTDESIAQLDKLQLRFDPLHGKVMKQLLRVE